MLKVSRLKWQVFEKLSTLTAEHSIITTSSSASLLWIHLMATLWLPNSAYSSHFMIPAWRIELALAFRFCLRLEDLPVSNRLLTNPQCHISGSQHSSLEFFSCTSQRPSERYYFVSKLWLQAFQVLFDSVTESGAFVPCADQKSHFFTVESFIESLIGD